MSSVRNLAAKMGWIGGMTLRTRLLLPIASLALTGCVVHTAYHVATAPVRATGWTYDRLTTSQAEADRKRGRREREAEARRAKAQRKAAREARREPNS